ncbi:putative cutinase transcription factor 1 protein [Ilyonectria robusta]
MKTTSSFKSSLVTRTNKSGSSGVRTATSDAAEALLSITTSHAPRHADAMSSRGRTRLATTSVSSKSMPLFPLPQACHKSQPGKTKDELGQNPSYPAFSFEALGVSKNMKIVLLGILTIFGTIETWVWCKAIWYWWKSDSDVEKE